LRNSGPTLGEAIALSVLVPYITSHESPARLPARKSCTGVERSKPLGAPARDQPLVGDSEALAQRLD
jgi:hypothetical protein